MVHTISQLSGKYVIYGSPNGEFPIIFPNSYVQHKDVLVKGARPVSAGFFVLKDQKIMVYGESTSLGLRMRPEDAEIISNYYNPV